MLGPGRGGLAARVTYMANTKLGNNGNNGSKATQAPAPTMQALQQQLAALQAANAALQAQLTGGQGARSSMVWQGHSLTSLVRAMAALGWGQGQIAKVTVALGFVPSPATLQTQAQLAKGSPGGNGKPPVAPKPGAKLTPAQLGHLQACITAPNPPAYCPISNTWQLPTGPVATGVGPSKPAFSPAPLPNGQAQAS